MAFLDCSDSSNRSYFHSLGFVLNRRSVTHLNVELATSVVEMNKRTVDKRVYLITEGVQIELLWTIAIAYQTCLSLVDVGSHICHNGMKQQCSYEASNEFIQTILTPVNFQGEITIRSDVYMTPPSETFDFGASCNYFVFYSSITSAVKFGIELEKELIEASPDWWKVWHAECSR